MPVLPPNITVASTLAEQSADYDISDARAMQALREAERQHFWFVARNALIRQKLERLGVRPPASLLELGCGAGSVASALSAAGYSVVGIDGHLPLLHHAALRAPGAQFIAADVRERLPPTTPSRFEAVCFFDVLEHLEDPSAAISVASERLGVGGLVVGTVPALMLLWSEIDVKSGHKRRYSRATLRTMLGSIAGFELVEIHDFNRHLVPLLWVQRRVLPSGAEMTESNVKTPAAPVNVGLRWLSMLERESNAALEALRIPGASLWFALRKTAH